MPSAERAPGDGCVPARRQWVGNGAGVDSAEATRNRRHNDSSGRDRQPAILSRGSIQRISPVKFVRRRDSIGRLNVAEQSRGVVMGKPSSSLQVLPATDNAVAADEDEFDRRYPKDRKFLPTSGPI